MKNFNDYPTQLTALLTYEDLRKVYMSLGNILNTLVYELTGEDIEGLHNLVRVLKIHARSPRDTIDNVSTRTALAYVLHKIKVSTKKAIDDTQKLSELVYNLDATNDLNYKDPTIH